tara:strand:- start:191 stop:379 length:189 start_codon:yes stop_codon:yes gene_type:complete
VLDKILHLFKVLVELVQHHVFQEVQPLEAVAVVQVDLLLHLLQVYLVLVELVVVELAVQLQE